MIEAEFYFRECMHQFVDDMLLHAQDIGFEIIAEADAYLPFLYESLSEISREYALDMRDESFEGYFFLFAGRMFE